MVAAEVLCVLLLFADRGDNPVEFLLLLFAERGAGRRGGSWRGEELGADVGAARSWSRHLGDGETNSSQVISPVGAVAPGCRTKWGGDDLGEGRSWASWTK